MQKYATAEERVPKNQRTTVRHFGFTEKVYGLPCMVRTLLFGSTVIEMPSSECTIAVGEARRRESLMGYSVHYTCVNQLKSWRI